MGTSAAEIESTLREKRGDLRSNINELSDKVKNATDWKHHYRQHTGTLIALAFSAGALMAVLGTRRPSASVSTNLVDQGNGWSDSLSGNGAALRRHGHEVLDRWDSIKRALVGVAATQVTGMLGRIIPGFHEQLRSPEKSANDMASRARDSATDI